ncbi:MAG: hypothetical protein QXD32_00610 [Nitrososphaerota archaeon]
MSELWLSFWKLPPPRRCELVWEYVRGSLNAIRYKPKNRARSAEIIASTAKYQYDISIKSYSYVFKYFSQCSLFSLNHSDRYTVVHITVRPAFIQDGFIIYMSEPYPTLVRGDRDSTGIATVAKTHQIADIRLACDAPHRVIQLIKYREKYRPLLYTPTPTSDFDR